MKYIFSLHHYAFGGVSAAIAFCNLRTPLRPRGRTGVFRRREGPPRSPLPGLALLCLLDLCLVPLRGVSSCRGSPPEGPLLGPLSLLPEVRHPSVSRLCACSSSTGASGRVFPVAFDFFFGDAFQCGRFPSTVSVVFHQTSCAID